LQNHIAADKLQQ